MHLVVQAAKDAHRVKKCASVLFLNIQAAFPNTVKNKLIDSMMKRRVPTVYINLFNKMLSERFTRLKFDDFTSDPITITNGTTQGCPLSMLFTCSTTPTSSTSPKDETNYPQASTTIVP